MTAGRWTRMLAACGLGLGAVAASAIDTPTAAGEEVVRAGAYELRTRILHAGTRSEGRVGRLFRDGVEVPGRAIGETIDAPRVGAGTVRFTYMGEARPHLWSISGWTDRAVAR